MGVRRTGRLLSFVSAVYCPIKMTLRERRYFHFRVRGGVKERQNEVAVMGAPRILRRMKFTGAGGSGIFRKVAGPGGLGDRSQKSFPKAEAKCNISVQFLTFSCKKKFGFSRGGKSNYGLLTWLYRVSPPSPLQKHMNQE